MIVGLLSGVGPDLRRWPWPMSGAGHQHLVFWPAITSNPRGGNSARILQGTFGF